MTELNEEAIMIANGKKKKKKKWHGFVYLFIENCCKI
jgi:hypothetical protein